MALSDSQLAEVADEVWKDWEDGDGRETLPEASARVLRAVAEAAVAEFCREVMGG